MSNDATDRRNVRQYLVRLAGSADRPSNHTWKAYILCYGPRDFAGVRVPRSLRRAWKRRSARLEESRRRENERIAAIFRPIGSYMEFPI